VGVPLLGRDIRCSNVLIGHPLHRRLQLNLLWSALGPINFCRPRAILSPPAMRSGLASGSPGQAINEQGCALGLNRLATQIDGFARSVRSSA